MSASPFRLPQCVTDTIAEIEDERDMARVLTVMFNLLVKGEIPDMGRERPVVRLMLSICNKQMEAWERRAAQLRESQRRCRGVDTMLTSTTREKERDEGTMREKVSPTPPYKERAGRKETKEQRDPRASVDVNKWFGEFWEEYPRKVSKKTAERAFRAAVGDGRLCAATCASRFRDIMRGLRAAKRSSQWNRDDGQYIPHPSTWLNQERWTDVLDAASCDVDAKAERRMSKADELAARLAGRRTA